MGVAKERAIEGLYVAMLCVACTNKWIMFYLHHPILLMMKELDAEIQICIASASGAHDSQHLLTHLGYLKGEFVKKEQQLFRIIEGWVQGVRSDV
jgi:hypothetical protein